MTEPMITADHPYRVRFLSGILPVEVLGWPTPGGRARYLESWRNACENGGGPLPAGGER